jgi:hypothetical protein
LHARAITFQQSHRFIASNSKHVRDRIVNAAKSSPTLHRSQKRALHYICRFVSRSESRCDELKQPISASIVQLGKRSFIATGQSRRQIVHGRSIHRRLL